jgi:hypothetical protein
MQKKKFLMSNYGIRHDPKVIMAVILSMLFPGDTGKKILLDSGLDISDRTLRRIKRDVKNMGVEQLIQDAHKVYLISNIDGFLDSIKLKQSMFGIVSSSTANNFEKIKAGQVVLEILKQTPDLYDPALSEFIKVQDDKKPKNENDTREPSKTEA